MTETVKEDFERSKITQLTASECRRKRKKYIALVLLLIFIEAGIVLGNFYYGFEVNVPIFLFVCMMTVIFAQEIDFWIIMEKLTD